MAIRFERPGREAIRPVKIDAGVLATYGVSLVLIAGVALFAAFHRRFKRKQRLALIEKGLSEAVDPQKEEQGAGP